jgi:hypothetical protein
MNIGVAMNSADKSQVVKPGIYFDVPEAEYRKWPHPSQSTLGMFRDADLCEKEIKYAIEHGGEDTDQMALGRMFEIAVNGGDPRGTMRLLPPEIKQRRGVAWEELRDANPGIDFLPKSEYDKRTESCKIAEAMAAQVHSDPVSEKLISGSKAGVAFVADLKFVGQSGQEVTHRVKGLLDYWNEPLGAIADLKSTSMGGQRSVGASFWRYGYDIQSALYTDAMRLLTGRDDLEFYFIFCRTVAPYVVTVYNGHNSTEMAGHVLSLGRAWYQVALERLAECRRTGVWNGYQSPDAPEAKVLDIMLPSWAS